MSAGMVTIMAIEASNTKTDQSHLSGSIDCIAWTGLWSIYRMVSEPVASR
ncbi:hypothetical protein RvVAT039_pl12900 (plasmid) [Agrobacterium vitis]|nr:hypothetical protein RvVAT039_pl12900 [Agrobacterium vitis]